MNNLNWIRKIRLKQGLKGFQLADRMQVSAARISVLAIVLVLLGHRLQCWEAGRVTAGTPALETVDVENLSLEVRYVQAFHSLR